MGSHSKGVGLAQQQLKACKKQDNEDLSLSLVFFLHLLPPLIGPQVSDLHH